MENNRCAVTIRAAGLVCLLAAFPMLAQEFRASITGRIVDPSSAAVPSAQVEVKNTATNEVSKAVTDAQGNYTALFLRPGSYALTVEHAGFKKFTREGLVLNVGQTAMVNIALEVGALAESVTVSGETPLLETTKADRGGVVDRLRVHELPLNARNPFMLGAIVPGVKYTGAIIWQRPFDNGAIAEWSVTGSRAMNSEFLLDGAPNNAQAGTNNLAYVPPVDSVEEFKIHTNIYDAQYGKTGGGIVNVSLKSGGNALHGAAYEFARRTAWDANTFQNNAASRPRTNHLLDQYGLQVDGPVYLPKLYDGRNRLFFMTNYERYREITPFPVTESVPAPEFLDGDYSKLVSPAGQQIVVFDPASGRQEGTNWVRSAFPGNLIPRNRINPVGRSILSYFPKPNNTTQGVDYSQANFYLPENIGRDAFYNFVVKTDSNIGNRHRLFFRYAANRRDERTHESGAVTKGPGQGGEDPSQRVNDHLTADWVAVIGPTFTFNLRTSFNRYVHTSTSTDNWDFDLTKLGFPDSMARQVPGGAHFGRYQFSGYSYLGYYGSGNWTNTWAVHPTASKIVSGHSLKFGVDMRWIQYLTKNLGNPLFFSSSRQFTQRDFQRADPLSGNAIAEFLLGIPNSGYSDFRSFPAFLYRYYAPYIQDDWKVTPRLTLNLGLRWDFNLAADERFDRLNRGFDTTSANPADALIDRKQFPDAPRLRGGLLFAGVGGLPRAAADADNNNIQPRLGAAYQVTPKVILRGGWGRTYLNPGNQFLQDNGFSLQRPYVASGDGGRTPQGSLSNPFPLGLPLPSGSSLGLSTFLGQGFSYVNTKFRTPYVNQFSLGLELELPHRQMLEVTYVGSRTRDMQDSRSLNEPDLAFRQKCNYMEGGLSSYCNALLPNPFQGIASFAPTGHYSNATQSRMQLARPYPHFGGLTEQMRNDGAMWFDSLQITHHARMRHVNLIAGYVFSKHLERSGFLDVPRNVMQKGLSSLDIPHRLTLTGIWELPFGKGRRMLNTSHGLWSRMVSGWELTGFLTIQSGRPSAMPGNVRYLRNARIDDVNWSAHRAYGVRPCVAQQNEDGRITPMAYSLTYGCGNDVSTYNFLVLTPYAPRETENNFPDIRQQAQANLDASINKTTRITERARIQFRAEAFNALNQFWFGRGQNFNSSATSSNFGTILPSTTGASAGNFPRHIQFAVKLLW